ncbi:MAG: energy-coupling factor transporter ATPase [Eubacteriales bacterium]|jgi:energy-coupling factor transport system ATP-binding protein|nr:energy-coupling factor transporter ATPase [Eubacteriales bacterium]
MPIIIKDLYYTYQKGTPYETHALKGVNLNINEGEFVGLIGHTGSGKSTLVQHLNGLVLPSSGFVQVDDLVTSDKKVKMRDVRKKVGLVFQYPEHQLFEETVEKDVGYGPENLGFSEKEKKKIVKDALESVQLDYKSIKDKSPFNLSGGQKRRVAIAGIIAMKPKYLVLDEPTAGLDPRGREEILFQIKKLHKETGMTIVLVSHSMEDVARFADKLIVMHKGQIEMIGKPEDIFKHRDRLKEIGLGVPAVTELFYLLEEKGIFLNKNIFTVEDAILELKKGLYKGADAHA